MLVVVPTFNERANLEALASTVLAEVPEAQLLIVDDASPDGTGELADRLAAHEPRLRVVHRSAKLGLGTAYREAFTRALDEDYALVAQMDADFSHDPRDLPRLVAAITAGADLAVGSRYVKGGGTHNWGLGRRLLSRGGSLYARTILDVPVRDLTAGFKCWRREALAQIDLPSVRSEGYAFQIEMTLRALRRGLRVVEVPIVFTERRAGQSKLSRGIVLEALLGVWRLRGRA